MPVVTCIASSVSSTSPGEIPSHTKPNRRQRSKKAHICKTCQKHFSRQEHCARHERSHTRERPFPCRYCPNRYARKDLVTRHEKSIHADVYTAPVQQSESISRQSKSLPDGAPSEKTKSPAQQEIELNSTLEDLMNVRSGAVQFPPSPQSSGARNDVDFEAIDGFRNNIELNFNMPLTPMEMELSDLSTDVAYSYPESRPSPSDDILLGDDFTQAHAPGNDQLRTEDFNANGFSVSHGQLPPHLLDPIFDDLDFFGVMPNSEPNGFLDSIPANEVCTADRNLPTNATYHQEGEQKRSSMESQNNNAKISEQRLSQVHAPDRQTERYSSADTSLEKINQQKQKVQSMVFDDRIRQSLLVDLSRRLSLDQCKAMKLPSASLLQRFVSSYQTCFHRHYPIIHLASMNLEQIPSPLLLAICAIGALYRLERKHAACLQHWADKATRSLTCFDPLSTKFSPAPVWATQTKLLVAFARVFSGVPNVVRTALESLEFFSMEYTSRRVDLARTRDSLPALSWVDWLERETSKRLLCGIFVLNSLVSITYNTTPRISLLPDAEIEIPSEESLWEAPTSRQWLQVMASRNQEPALRVIDAVNHVLFRNPVVPQDGGTLSWSTFATTIVIHAVNAHIHHLIQCTQAFTIFSLDNASQSMRAAAVHQAESALERCQNLFTDRQSEQEQTLDDPGGSRRSNGLALLRVACVRTCTETESLNRLVVLSTNSEDTAKDLQEYLGFGQKRTSQVTLTARKALDGLFTAVRAGTLLAMKTAALRWSIDHAIADWNCALFVTRWIHTLECHQQSNPLDFEERQILEDVIELLSDADIGYDGCTSLAAAVVRLWADFFDDTWVWGITPRIGGVMRTMATVCESDLKARRMRPYSGPLS